MTTTPTQTRHWTYSTHSNGTVTFYRDGERRELLAYGFLEEVLVSALALLPVLPDGWTKPDVVEALLEALLGDPEAGS